MSVANVFSRALAGVDAPLVTVEVHIAGGLPGIHLVGLPDTVTATRGGTLDGRPQKPALQRARTYIECDLRSMEES